MIGAFPFPFLRTASVENNAPTGRADIVHVVPPRRPSSDRLSLILRYLACIITGAPLRRFFRLRPKRPELGLCSLAARFRYYLITISLILSRNSPRAFLYY
jgi:hypothetical protein